MSGIRSVLLVFFSFFLSTQFSTAENKVDEDVRKKLTVGVNKWLKGIAKELKKDDMTYDGETLYFSDLDGDGDEDVVVQYMVSGMGSGTGFFSHAFFRNDRSKAVLESHIEYIESDYGNSRGGQSIRSVSGNSVTMEAWDLHDEDGECCPTLRTILEYEYSGGALSLLRIVEPQRRILEEEEPSTRTLQTFGVMVVEEPTPSGLILRPIDETSTDGKLQAVRDGLLAAVIKNDEKAVRRFVATDVENGLDGVSGITEFMKIYRSRLREELKRALENGGSLVDVETFISPSVYGQFPDQYAETYAHGVIYGDSVNIRSRADISSEVLRRLSWEVVEVPDWQPVPDGSGKSFSWYQIRTLDGSMTGYVSSQYLWSSGSFRAVFRKVDGGWKLSGWYEGE